MNGKEKKYHNIKVKLDCEKCKGMRLKDEALCVKINNLNISEVTEKSIDHCTKMVFKFRKSFR